MALLIFLCSLCCTMFFIKSKWSNSALSVVKIWIYIGATGSRNGFLSAFPLSCVACTATRACLAAQHECACVAMPATQLRGNTDPYIDYEVYTPLTSNKLVWSLSHRFFTCPGNSLLLSSPFRKKARKLRFRFKFSVIKFQEFYSKWCPYMWHTKKH